MTPVGVPVVFGLWFLHVGILLWLETSVVSRELQAMGEGTSVPLRTSHQMQRIRRAVDRLQQRGETKWYYYYLRYVTQITAVLVCALVVLVVMAS